jgi:CubicO group peptidase (beta-lactamase class C family)
MRSVGVGLIAVVLTLVLVAALPLTAWSSDAVFTGPEDDHRIDRINELMMRYEELGLFSGAVLAAEGGEVLYESAFGMANRELGVPNTADTRFRIASISKPFTTVLVLQMVEDGKLSLDDTLAELLPGYSGEGADRITVEQLLTHTSGLVGENAVENLEDIERHHWTKEELLELVTGYPLASRPGKRYRYANFGYLLLAAILEEVSGHSYAELLQDGICEPAGLTSTGVDVTAELVDSRAAGYHYYSETGVVNAPFIEMSFVYGYGQLLSTAHDLFLFERALRSCELLSFENTQYMLAADSRREPLGSSGHEEDVFRYGGSVNGFLCSTHSYIQDDRFVAVLSNVKDSRGGTLPSTFDVARNIAAILYGLEYELPE